jgi:hypothetical protein
MSSNGPGNGGHELHDRLMRQAQEPYFEVTLDMTNGFLTLSRKKSLRLPVVASYSESAR